MAIRGSLREASLPDVLQLLAMGKKTGCLSVTFRSQFGSVYFEDGRISFASIVNRRDRLGDVLVHMGLISREQREQALALQRERPTRRLGDILIDMGCLTREALHRHVRTQIEEAVYFLFTWNDGTFSFEPDVRPEEQDFLVAINPESLLLEGARRIDEWSEIAKQITSFDMIFTADAKKVGNDQLTAEQQRLLPLIDGQRDVQALIDESGLAEFEVGKGLYGLLQAGALTQVGNTRRAEQPNLETRVAEHRNLGIAFYKTDMLDEATRELKRVLELRPGDEHAVLYLGLVAIRRESWADAIELFRRLASRTGTRATALVNLAWALERSGDLDGAAKALVDADKLLPSEPLVALGMGSLALRRGELAAARSHLATAKGRFGTRPVPPVWFHLAGLAAADDDALDDAIAILEEGVAAYPASAVLYNNLAAVQERRGRLEDAMRAAERGLLEDATVGPLHKNLGDLLYRSARYGEALEAYQRAVRQNASLGPDVYLKMGNIRYRRHEREGAIDCWNHTLALSPKHPIALRNLEMARHAN